MRPGCWAAYGFKITTCADQIRINLSDKSAKRGELLCPLIILSFDLTTVPTTKWFTQVGTAFVDTTTSNCNCGCCPKDSPRRSFPSRRGRRRIILRKAIVTILTSPSMSFPSHLTRAEAKPGTRVRIRVGAFFFLRTRDPHKALVALLPPRHGCSFESFDFQSGVLFYGRIGGRSGKLCSSHGRLRHGLRG